MEVNKPLYKPREVASLFQVTMQTVYNWINDGKLQAYRIGSILRIPKDSILEWIQEMENIKSGKKKRPYNSIIRRGF